MFISPETRAAILADLKQPNSDIQRVSRAYGVPIRFIRDILPPPPPAPTNTEVFEGYGRPELQKYLISRTRAGAAWPAADAPAIQHARNEYDAGIIEMCTGRDGDWLILYAIPRRTPAHNRLPYFKGLMV